MKRLLVILIVVLAVMGMSFGTVSAEDTSGCKQIAELAAEMMDARQSGVPMYKQIEVINNEPGLSDLTQLLERIIVDAYDSPRYSTQSHKKQAIDDFRNDVYLECFRSINN